MLKDLIVLCGALIGFTAAGWPQENAPGVSGLDAIAARQASLDMSSITFRSMGDAMKAGREARSQGYAAAALAKWAKALPRIFPAGTGVAETSVDTQALPDYLERPGQLRSGGGLLCRGHSAAGCPGRGQRHRRFHKTA